MPKLEIPAEMLEEVKKLIEEKKEEFLEFNGKMWSNSIGKDLTFDQAKEFAKDCRDGGFIYVVYKCDGKWDDFINYTAEKTHATTLNFTDKPVGKESK